MNYFSIIADFNEDMPQISPKENSILTLDFSEKEVFDYTKWNTIKLQDQTGFQQRFIRYFGKSSKVT